MVDLPKKKVGIIACSCEELPEGTVTRLAALKVLEDLRPAETVTICLPLFLAGGEGDRAFARFYPTIAVDGCALRCAAHGTEKYSGKPAASLVVSEIVQQEGLDQPEGQRRLNEAGLRAVERLSELIADQVDELLGKKWNRRTGDFPLPVINSNSSKDEPEIITCSCGSGIPVQKITIKGIPVSLVGVPLIFQQFREAGKFPSEATQKELFETVKIYNAIPAGQEEAYSAAVLREYSAYYIQGQTG